MAGEYQNAERAVDECLHAAECDAAVDEDVLLRALMYAVIARYQRTRSAADIASELEHHVRALADGDEIVVTRGC